MTKPNLLATLAAEYGEPDAQCMASAYLLAGELTDEQIVETAALPGVERMEYLTGRYESADAYVAACTDFAVRRQHMVDGT
ncbi:hypothetical protein ABT369_39285 [Dactylosporangium sp. NPDC000244]|uniref:hypothetical protein n=1 Tax=Dactylosporangium sp. NPDC000244 TaxID=3154365 RepID=UPI003333CBBF